jgi:hypothetical protein
MTIKNKVKITLLTLSVICWVHTLLVTKIVDTTHAELGLAQLFPISFWFGLIACALSLVLAVYGIKASSHVWLVISLILLLLYLHGTPSLVEENPRFPDVYLHMGSVRNILADGHVSASSLNYPNYPGIFILFASFISVTGMPLFFVMKYYTVFFVALLSTLIYLVAYGFTRSKRYATIAPAVFFPFAWFREFHLCPQSFGLILVMMAIYVYFRKENWQMHKRVTLLMIFLICSIVISHSGTSMFLILFLGAFSLVVRNGTKIRLKSPYLFFLSIIFFIGWGVFQVPFIFKDFILRISRMHSLDTMLRIFTTHTSSFILSPIQTIINYLRIGQSVLFWLIGFVLIITCRMKNNIVFEVLVYWIGSTFAFGFVILLGAYGFWERVAIYSFIPISIFYSWNISKQTISKSANIIFLSMLLLSISVLPLTIYGNEGYEYVPTVDLSAQQYATAFTENITIADYWPIIKYYSEIREKNLKCVDIRSNTAFFAADAVIFTVIVRNIYWNRFRSLVLQDRLTEFQQSPSWNRVYDNGYSFVYYRAYS